MSKNSAKTKLPSQVQKISDNAEALAQESGMKDGKPLKVVETVSAVIKNEPAKVDQNDYKTRYSNYKKATDQTISELRQTLANVQATLADVQRQNQELLTTSSAQASIIADKPGDKKSLSGTKEDPAYLTYLDKLPKSVKDEYTEDYLFDQFLFQKAAAPKSSGPSENLTALETKVNTVMKTEEERKHEAYLDAMDDAFPKDEWITLATGEDWNKFCAQIISDVDHRTFGQLVKEGSETHTATTVIWVLNQYKQHLSTLEAADDVGDTTNTLENQLTPEGAGGGGGDPVSQINAQAETFTSSQVTQFFTDVATTDKYTAEEAAAIEKNIMAAQVAGKIIQG